MPPRAPPGVAAFFFGPSLRLLELAPCVRAFRPRCQRHHKRESQQRVNGCRTLRSQSRVKCWATTLPILALLSATLALAEDFKTINGKEYKDATIIRVEADGIILRTKTGISKIYFIELPKDVQGRFRPTP